MPRVAVVLALLVLTPAAASADWLITPFIGTAFSGETTLLALEQGAGQKKLTFGVSGMLLSDNIFGIEGSLGHTPGFFQGDDPLGLIPNSRVTTVTGSVVIAAPLAMTRESLRPYIVGGVGLMQARAASTAGIFPIEKDFLVVDLGGGAIGLISPRTGVQFEIRHFKAASGADGPLARKACRASASGGLVLA